MSNHLLFRLKAKPVLAIISIFSFIFIVLKGDLLTDLPSSTSVVLLFVGGAAFSVLFFLRLVSFIVWVFGGNKA